MLIGDLRVDAVSDGTFVSRPAYFGPDLAAGARPDFFSRQGAAWLPIGCFVIRGGDRLMLVDAGLGPARQELPHDMHLVGGQLLTGLRALGVTPAEVTDVICTHLHADHVGWLFHPDAQRALLLGDAITCPVQLDEPAWHSLGDVDPALAARTRERLWRELEDDRTTGAGAHFPELRFGRVLRGVTRRWHSS